MPGTAALIIKIMPDSLQTNLKEIKEKVEASLKKEGALNINFEEQPIGFGLKAIMAKFAWPEEKDTDIIERTVSQIEHVSSVNIEDYRRAFG